MAKNFRIANVEVRNDMGQFSERYKQPAPPEIVRRSTAEGTSVTDLLAQKRNQAMDHNSPGGQPGVGQNPWPPAQPATSKPPFRLKP